MRFEILIQFIVPLTFLAIWALTSLLNRDAQPLPPRPGRPPGPGGVRPQNRAPGQAAPRPPGPGAPPPQPEAAAPRAERPEGRLDFGALQPPRERTPQRPSTGGMDDAIVYIENGPGARGATRPSATPPLPGASPSPSGSRPTRGGQQRRGGRSRTAPGGLASQARSEPETHRALSDQVNQSLAKQRTKPLELTPLNSPLGSLFVPLSQSPAASQVGNWQSNMVQPTLTGAEIRKMLASPSKLREIALLSEILQPPVTLRRRQLHP